MSENRKAGSIRSFLINTECQRAWDELLQNYLSESCSISDLDVMDYIQSVQHYTLQDPSQDYPSDTESLLKALHYMSCIAYTLASNAFYERISGREQLTKNLFLCINAINMEAGKEEPR